MPIAPPPRPRTPRAERTRSSLYSAAARLFVSQGYESTTMADIAAEAGTARRTAFNHFPNKGDFAMVWVRQMADLAIEGLSTSSTDDVLEDIRTYFHTIATAVESEPELSRQMLLGWTAALGPALYESQLLSDVTPLLLDGQAAGRIKESVDVAVVARVLSDVLQGAAFRWVREPESPLVERVDSAVAVVVGAVAAH